MIANKPKVNILVVDDEPVARQSLTDILKLEGFNVSSVASGEAAVEYVRLNSVDLVVLDIRMPGMSGLEVVQVLSQMTPDTEIIMLTAHGSMETAVEALRSRVHDYLTKPASPRQIIESVNKGLARRAARIEERKIREEGGDIERQKSIINLEDGIEVDLERRSVRVGENITYLTPAEGRLLKVLLENPSKVFSHRELILLVQGYEASHHEAQEILRPLVSRLRNKLDDYPSLRNRIVSVRGTGYVLEDQN